MKLGELIQNYRETHDLSQRQFATLCGLSNAYISILEKGINPRTSKPVTPTLPQLKKIADCMSMSVMELFDSVDDMPIDLTPEKSTSDQFPDHVPHSSPYTLNQILLDLTPLEKEIIVAYRHADELDRRLVLRTLKIDAEEHKTDIPGVG